MKVALGVSSLFHTILGEEKIRIIFDISKVHQA
jgi:hypothetical protein